jgi:hypothetical protein
MERSDSLLGDHRGGNISGQKKDQVKGTHKVEIAEGGTCGHRRTATE